MFVRAELSDPAAALADADASAHASRPRALRRALARHGELAALWLILAAGAALRAWLTLRWRPAFVGFPDTIVYISDARAGIFSDPLHLGGYAEFLRLMHGISPHLAFAIVVQHLLGLASAALLFAAVRRAGVARGAGLVPAAVVALGGSELLVEHAPLTEALFILLVDLSLYALVRTWRGRWAWSIIAGAALGAAADVRTVGLALVVVASALLLALLRGGWRQGLLRACVCLAAAAVPLGAYLRAHEHAVGYGGFTGAGYLDLYARVAPFADCSKFTPPPGTRMLCVRTPRSRRRGHDVWEFTINSPAVQAFGFPDTSPAQPGENAKLREFAVAAILGQPLEYLEAVARDLVRIVDPSFASSPYTGNSGYGSTPEELADYYVNTRDEPVLRRVVLEYYGREADAHGDIAPLRAYERATRVEGPLMALLLALASLAPLLCSAEARRASLLFLLVALTLLVVPVLTSEYDYRFTIPAFGPLAAAAAIGGWALAMKLRTLAMRLRVRAAGGALVRAGCAIGPFRRRGR